jgi:hypothetical protein
MAWGTFAFFLYGCTSIQDSPHSGSSGPNSGNQAFRTDQSAGSDLVSAPLIDSPHSTKSEPVSTVVDARPAALVNGMAVNWGELRPLLNELAGAEALQEIILDRKLAESLPLAGISITEDDIAREKKLLLESLNDDPNVALRLLDELRERQRLGKVRFEALMRRNAGLRALVKANVVVSPEAVRNMHDTVHGPRRQARLMLFANLESAQAAINLVNSGVNFNDVAAEMSIDSSAPRGGLLEPISQSDPNYPEALRQTLWTLEPGQMSGPVLVGNQYAVIMLVKRIAGDTMSLEEARPSLERLVRLNQERLLMDQIARRMLLDSAISVFDDELHESWKRRGKKSPEF